MPGIVTPKPAVENHAKDLVGKQHPTARVIRPTVLNLDRLVRETSRIFRSNWHLVISVSVLITLGELSSDVRRRSGDFWPL